MARHQCLETFVPSRSMSSEKLTVHSANEVVSEIPSWRWTTPKLRVYLDCTCKSRSTRKCWEK
eukprot:4540483-Amphidinium_carterae.1